MHAFKAVFFDLDGTLIDNYTAIWKTLSAVFSEFGIEEPPYENVFKSVGGSILLTIEKLLPQQKRALAAAMGARYMELNPNFVYDGLKVMPHSRELLCALSKKNLKLACFTNKQTEAADAILERLGLKEYFCAVCATTLTSARKPDREFGLSALSALNVRACDSLFIGDSPYDCNSAENVGAACALVTTGADDAEHLSKTCKSALGIFANLKDLAKSIFDVEI